MCDPSNRKMVGTPCLWAELTFEWCESAMIFRVFIFIFILFRSNGKKNTWMRTTFIKVMYDNYFKNTILKVTWYQLFSKLIKNHEDFKNAILKVTWYQLFSKLIKDYEAHWKQHLKDILLLKILRTWINIRTNSLLDKCDETKMGEMYWKLLAAQKSEPVIWRILHQDISFIIALFFFSETNLVFKFNLVLCWSNNFLHNLFTFLTFDSLRLVEFIQCLNLLIRTTKILMRLTAAKCFSYVLNFHETFAPVDDKNYSWY